eukprot:PhF_6_TR33064/c0_g1_i2/m.48709
MSAPVLEAQGEPNDVEREHHHKHTTQSPHSPVRDCSCDVTRGFRSSLGVLKRSVVGLVCLPYEIVVSAIHVVGCPIACVVHTVYDPDAETEKDVTSQNTNR